MSVPEASRRTESKKSGGTESEGILRTKTVPPLPLTLGGSP